MRHVVGTGAIAANRHDLALGQSTELPDRRAGRAVLTAALPAAARTTL